MKQVFSVLSEQAVTDEPFGQVAIRFDFLTTEQLNDLLRQQEQLATPIEEILEVMGYAVTADELEWRGPTGNDHDYNRLIEAFEQTAMQRFE